MRREILALTENFFQLVSLKQGKVCPLFRLPWLAFFLIIMCITCRDVWENLVRRRRDFIYTQL